MTEIKIEKGVPMPEYGKGSSGSKYPFRNMKVGDSFVVDNINMRNSAWAAASYLGLSIRTRREGEDGKYRVWLAGEKVKK